MIYLLILLPIAFAHPYPPVVTSAPLQIFQPHQTVRQSYSMPYSNSYVMPPSSYHTMQTVGTPYQMYSQVPYGVVPPTGYNYYSPPPPPVNNYYDRPPAPSPRIASPSPPPTTTTPIPSTRRYALPAASTPMTPIYGRNSNHFLSGLPPAPSPYGAPVSSELHHGEGGASMDTWEALEASLDSRERRRHH